MARTLVQGVLGGSRHVGRVLEQVDVAITGADDECQGLVVAEGDSVVATGIVLFGPVAGASGVLKIHALVGANADVMMTLAKALVLGPQVCAARLIMCEIADDPACAGPTSALLASGFAQEGRVEDYFARGSHLDILVFRP